MTVKQAKALARRVNKRYGESVAKLYDGYSGRGMYGAETTGVVLPSWAVSNGHKWAQDNMGKDTILY